MKKVVFFVTGLDSGGIENYLLRFLQYKATAFSKVVVYCKGGKGGQLEDDYLKIPNVSILKSKVSFLNPGDYLQLISYLRKERFDVMCDFTGNFAGLILLCAKKADINNRIVFYRGATDHFSKNIVKNIYNNCVKKITYKHATHILSNSQAAFDYFYNKKQQDIRFKVIYNGVDASKIDVGNKNLRKEFNIPDNAFVIGHTGRFNYAKNHDVIIKVAKNLMKKHSDIYFIMCGNGVKEGLDSKVKELKINKNTRLFDFRRDIPIFLNTMDVYFFPSVTEGQPNALIEAMIIGLPFVASDIPPIKETVDDDEVLFNPFDVEGFSKALENLYFEKVKRNMTIKQKMIKKFNYKERFNEFYKKLND